MQSDCLTVNEVEDMITKTHDSMKARRDQLEALTGIQMSKQLNDASYNSVIDHCNDADVETAEFFRAIISNDL